MSDSTTSNGFWQLIKPFTKLLFAQIDSPFDLPASDTDRFLDLYISAPNTKGPDPPEVGLLHYLKENPRPSVLLLTGPAGSGKTTLINFVLRKERTSLAPSFPVYVDMRRSPAYQSASQDDLGIHQAISEALATIVGKKRIDEIVTILADRAVPPFDLLELSRRIHPLERTELVDKITEIAAQSLPQWNEALLKYLSEYDYRGGVFLIIDNMDHHAPGKQADAIALAYSLAQRTRCKVVLPVRPETMARPKSVLSARAFVGYTLSVNTPPLREVLRARTKQFVRGAPATKCVSINNRQIAVSGDSVAHLIDLAVDQIHASKAAVIIGDLANHSMRQSLLLAQNILASFEFDWQQMLEAGLDPSATLSQASADELLGSLLKSDDLATTLPEKPFFDVFAHTETRTTYLRLEILEFGAQAKSFRRQQLAAYLASLGYNPSDTAEIDDFLEAGLLSALTDDRLWFTPKGRVHRDYLVFQPFYVNAMLRRSANFNWKRAKSERGVNIQTESAEDHVTKNPAKFLLKQVSRVGPSVSMSLQARELLDRMRMAFESGEEPHYSPVQGVPRKPEESRQENICAEYHVALSFAGEDREHASALAQLLRDSGFSVFFDEYEKSSLWGKDLYTRLTEVYRDKSRFCVMFISKHYAGKVWTNHERRIAQARAFEDNEEYILPLRLDDTEVPGVLNTIGYLDLREHDIQFVFDVLREKLLNSTESGG